MRFRRDARTTTKTRLPRTVASRPSMAPLRLQQQRGSSAARDRLSGEAAISGCGASDAAIVFRAQVASLKRRRGSAASTRCRVHASVAKRSRGHRTQRGQSDCATDQRRVIAVRRIRSSVQRLRTIACGRERKSGERAAHRHGAVAFGAGAASRTRRLPASSHALRMVVARSGPRCRFSAGSRKSEESGPPHGRPHARGGLRRAASLLLSSSLTTRAVPRTRGRARSQRTPSARRYRRCC